MHKGLNAGFPIEAFRTTNKYILLKGLKLFIITGNIPGDSWMRYFIKAFRINFFLTQHQTNHLNLFLLSALNLQINSRTNRNNCPRMQANTSHGGTCID